MVLGQVLAALWVSCLRWPVGTVRRLGTERQPWLTPLLRLFTEAAALVGLVALSQEISHDCSPANMAHVASVALLVGEIGLCVSIGLYVSVCVSKRRRSTLKRLMSVFAITALSAGTLTWATGSSQMTSQCVHQQQL